MVDAWEARLTDGDLTGFAASLIHDHYDPAYAKSRDSQCFETIAEFTTQTLDDAGLNALAHQIAKRIRA